MAYKNENVTLGNNCNVSEETDLCNVMCGDNVIINSGVSLKNVVIGNNTKISRNITLYSTNENKPILIGDDVWMSHGVFGEATGGQIIIGSYTVIAHFTTLLTSSGPGRKSYILNEIYPEEIGDIIIDEHCWIGAHSLLLPNVKFPTGVVVASNSVVSKDEYQEWSLYAGSPVVFKKKIK